MLEPILFFALAVIAIAAGIGMIVHRNPVYSVLLLIITLFSLAGFYVLLNATFVAAVHMIVYAGAIMVLFLFVIMLLDLREESDRFTLKKFSRVLAFIAAIIFLGEAFLLVDMAISDGGLAIGMGAQTAQVGDTPALGKLLFTKYLLPFEIASVLLLVAIVGAVILAKRELLPKQAG
ncbi:MAG: NADH-quinone oxidoreductase subunit J [bacterium]